MTEFDTGDTVIPKYNEVTYDGTVDKQPTFVTQAVMWGLHDHSDKSGYVEYQTKRYDERLGEHALVLCRMVLTEKTLSFLYDGKE